MQANANLSVEPSTMTMAHPMVLAQLMPYFVTQASSICELSIALDVERASLDAERRGRGEVEHLVTVFSQEKAALATKVAQLTEECARLKDDLRGKIEESASVSSTLLLATTQVAKLQV